MRHSTLLVSGVLFGMSSFAMADITLDYLGATDQGGGMWLHEYVGTRTIDDLTPVRDLHIYGQFDFEQGNVTLFAPGDWSTTVYTGPGQYLFNWQVEQAEPWTTGNLAGFGILVDSPAVTSTPFHWTDNEQFPNFPDLGNVIATGETYVPIPTPGGLSLLVVGGLGMANRRRRS